MISLSKNKDLRYIREQKVIKADMVHVDNLFWYKNVQVLLTEQCIHPFDVNLRPDTFYFSYFNNPDSIFSRNGKQIRFFIADRMKIVPNL